MQTMKLLFPLYSFYALKNYSLAIVIMAVNLNPLTKILQHLDSMLYSNVISLGMEKQLGTQLGLLKINFKEWI